MMIDNCDDENMIDEFNNNNIIKNIYKTSQSISSSFVLGKPQKRCTFAGTREQDAYRRCTALQRFDQQRG